MKSLIQFIKEAQRDDLIPINIIIGRFQPFTKGHEECANYAFDQSRLQSVLCVIDTKKADEKHPFLTKDMEDVLDSIVKESENIIGWVRVSNADIVKNAETLRANGFEPMSWSCGSDRINDYTKMSKNYGGKAGLDPDFEMFEIPRTDEDISATKVRKSLKEDDTKTFEKLVPRYLHKYFSKLKTLIEQI